MNVFKTLSLKLYLSAFLILSALQSNAQLADTVKKDLFTAPDTVKHLHSKTWALVPPAALIAYGGLSFAITPIRHFDYIINNGIQRSDPTFSTKAESYFQFAPIIAVYGLNLIGVEGKNRFIDRTAILGLSAGILGISATITKHATHRERPNHSDYLSFPSGHTSTAFLGAEFLAQEYSDKSVWYGVAGYTVAATTGIFRLYNRDHWFSDVVAGAGYGILSTKLSYLIYPYLRDKLTHKDKEGRSSLVMPYYQDGIAGITLTKEL